MRRGAFRWQRLLDAPVIAIPLADPRAYTERYSEADKKATGLGAGAEAWPAPYWTIDASMSVMTMLLAAEALGLGALFFGVFKGERRAAPGARHPVGDAGARRHRPRLAGPAGRPPPTTGADDTGPAARAGRPGTVAATPDEIIHRGGWRC